MHTQMIDGHFEAERVYADLKDRITSANKSTERIPGLAIVLVGEDRASQLYVNKIVEKCDEIGLNALVVNFADNVTDETVLSKINELNHDCDYCGILVQFPLPKGFDELKIREAIAPDKDIDSAGSVNIGKFYATADCYIPCTPKSMYRLLKNLNLELVGKHAVVIGRSHVVGKPISDLLLRENMTVTICHSKTKDLKAMTLQADVIMLGVGKPNLLTGDMIKEGAIVIDAGINMHEGKLVGDADTASLMDKAAYLTPVPGGVGPMTIAMLVENVMEASLKSCE